MVMKTVAIRCDVDVFAHEVWIHAVKDTRISTDAWATHCKARLKVRRRMGHAFPQTYGPLLATRSADAWATEHAECGPSHSHSISVVPKFMPPTNRHALNALRRRCVM